MIIIVFFFFLQLVQQLGITADAFDQEDSAQWAFQSAVAAMMPGVFPDEITVNLVSTLTMENGTLTVIHRRRLYNKPTALGINYNVTLGSIERFGFNDPVACYQAISGQLIAGIANGNFSSAIQAISSAMNVTLFPSATSGAEDYVFIRDFVMIGTPKQTMPPSSFPSSTPTGPTGSPTQGFHTNSPTRWIAPHMEFEIGAGIILAALCFAFVYITAVITGYMRSPNDFINDKVLEYKIRAAAYFATGDIRLLFVDDVKYYFESAGYKGYDSDDGTAKKKRKRRAPKTSDESHAVATAPDAEDSTHEFVSDDDDDDDDDDSLESEVDV